MGDRMNDIFRQRLVIEGDYTQKITSDLISRFMKVLSKKLGMTIVFGPRVMRRCEKINPKHMGFEAVMVWAESGVQLYSWERCKFITIDIFCCHKFDIDVASKLAAKTFGIKIMMVKEV